MVRYFGSRNVFRCLTGISSKNCPFLLLFSRPLSRLREEEEEAEAVAGEDPLGSVGTGWLAGSMLAEVRQKNRGFGGAGKAVITYFKMSVLSG